MWSLPSAPGERPTQTNLDPTEDEVRWPLLKLRGAEVSTQNVPTFANTATKPPALSVRAQVSRAVTPDRTPRPTEGWSPARAPATGSGPLHTVARTEPGPVYVKQAHLS